MERRILVLIIFSLLPGGSIYSFATSANLQPFISSTTSVTSRLPKLSPGSNIMLDQYQSEYYQSDYSVEPYVAVDKNGTIHVAWMAPGGIWYSESGDGGLTFDMPTQVSHISCPDCKSGYADPSIGLSPNGEVFVAFSNGDKSGNNHLVVARKSMLSPYLPTQFVDTIVESCTRCFDRPWLAIDKSGTIFLVWYLTSDPYGTWWAKSTDDGRTFSTPTQVEPAWPGGWPGGITVDTSGDLHIAMLGWSRGGKPPDAILYAKPTSEGFATRKLASVNEPYTENSNLGQEFWPGPAIVVDQSDVYVVYASSAGKSLYLRHSGTNGASWDPPVLVGASQGLVEMPWLAAMNGTLLIAWRENGSGFWNTYLSAYGNGSVSEPVKVSDLNGYPADVMNWHGDFLGVAFKNSSAAVVVWSDGRSLADSSFGHGNIYLSVVQIRYPGQSYTTSAATLFQKTSASNSSSVMMPLPPVTGSSPISAGSEATYGLTAIGVAILVAASVVLIRRRRRTKQG